MAQSIKNLLNSLYAKFVYFLFVSVLGDVPPQSEPDNSIDEVFPIIDNNSTD